MSEMLVISREGYGELREIATALSYVARDIRGLVPNHLWSRAYVNAAKLDEILKDDVDILTGEGERSHVNIDADWPEVEK